MTLGKSAIDSGYERAYGQLSGVRVELHAWLTDLEALRPFVDPGNANLGEFQAAWSNALVMANRAAVKYAKAVEDVTKLDDASTE